MRTELFFVRVDTDSGTLNPVCDADKPDLDEFDPVAWWEATGDLDVLPDDYREFLAVELPRLIAEEEARRRALVN